MAVFSVIKLSELEGAKRIDAEYYKSEYSSLLKTLYQKKALPVKKIAVPVKRKFKPKYGEFFDYIEIGEVDLSTGEFNTSKIKGENAPDRAQWIVEKNDILISTVRPIRNAVVLIREERKNLVCSSGFAVIHPTDSVSPEYLFLYFKLKSIARLLDRYTTATEYPAITWKDILNVPIYLGTKEFQDKISKKVKEAFKLLDQSRFLYSQAETLLLEELGLKDYKPKYEKTYIAKLSSVLSSYRIDAEYFQPVYEEMIKKLQKRSIELKPLKEFILGVKKGIEIGSENYQDEGKPFIRVSNLSVYGFTDRDQKYLSEELYQQLKDDYEPKKGDFLLTKDATPGIAYVVKENIEGIISSGILRLQIDESKIDKEYLALCINSIVGKMQVERDVGGSVILHWKPDQVKRLKIPILPTSIQKRIASLVQQSYEARKKAKTLLEVAKKAIEIAIEKNEDKALDYISKVTEDRN